MKNAYSWRYLPNINRPSRTMRSNRRFSCPEATIPVIVDARVP